MNLLRETFEARKTKINLRVLTQMRQNQQAQRCTLNDLKSLNFHTHRHQRHFTKQVSKSNLSKRTLTSVKNTSRKNGGCLSNSYSVDCNNRVKIVKEEIMNYVQKTQSANLHDFYEMLQQIFSIGENINQNFYNYSFIQKKLKQLNDFAKRLYSKSCQFYCYCISGLILFEYSSLSLTIFYFDKALKALSLKNIYYFDCRLELSIYRYTSKIFLQMNKIKQAKDMAYMYLRKTWKYKNLDEQMNAYDLLGQVQLQQGNMDMSRYFHWRMCYAVKQDKQIVAISNQELDKKQKKQYELTVYEDIMAFVKSSDQIVSILSNHFRSEAECESNGSFRKNKQIFMYTHRSSNRVLRNHRVFQRKLIDEKQSTELHFIRPKQITKLRKIITEFNSFIFDMKKDWLQTIRQQEQMKTQSDI